MTKAVRYATAFAKQTDGKQSKDKEGHLQNKIQMNLVKATPTHFS